MRGRWALGGAPGRGAARGDGLARLPGGEHLRAPEIRLLCAHDLGLDEAGLRARARGLRAPAGGLTAVRSYRFPWALVAWHDGPVGVDLERVGPVGRAFADSIATPAERTDLAGRPDIDAWVAGLWCSKEALAKALGDAVDYDPRRLESPMRWPGLRSGPWRARPVPGLPAGHVGWLCWGERPAGGESG